MTQTPHPRHLLAAAQVARDCARKWPGVDVEDITQTLHLWLIERPDMTAGLADLGPVGDIRLKVRLREKAHQACAAEFRHRNHLPDQTWYTREQVKRILPYLWDGSETVTGGPGSEELLATFADVASAYKQLPLPEKYLLAWRYHDDATYQTIADRTGGTADSARKACDRALDRLHRALGGQRLDQDLTDPLPPRGPSHTEHN